jgi:hypothetical protein
MWSVLTSTAEKGIELPNEWAVPSTAPEEWWKGLPVGKITIMVRDNEILRDDILTFAVNIHASKASRRWQLNAELGKW